MKRSISTASAILIAIAAIAAAAGDVVLPQTLSCTNLRDQASINYASSASFVAGNSILFTNCLAYSGGTTNSDLQGMSNVTVSVSIGNSSASTSYVGGSSGADGDWYCTGSVPTNMPNVYFQLTITDENTNSYSYPQMMIKALPAL